MKTSPNIEAIKKWLKENNPLNIFSSDFSMTDIDPKEWSGHFDYLIEIGGRKMVLRFKGPEWGETKGVADEFKNLRGVESYEVGPKAFYYNENFFGEPMVLEEYLEGKLFSDLPEPEQKNQFNDVSKFIYKISSIPFEKNSFPFQEPMMSYTRNKNSWKTRIEFILGTDAKTAGEELFTFLPAVHSILDKFEDRLQSVLKAVGPSFIFESAHIGHLLKTKSGYKFFNWEQVSYGDPSFTLAVFLTSIHNRPDFEEIKEKMIASYLQERNIPEFKELVEQRITERHISNVIWVAYNNAKRGIAEIPNWFEKKQKIESIIDANK